MLAGVNVDVLLFNVSDLLLNVVWWVCVHGDEGDAAAVS